MRDRSLQLRRIRHSSGVMIVALGFAFLIVACTSDTLGPVPRFIEATPSEKQVLPRDTFRIVVQARGSNGEVITRPAAAFRSTEAAVARVDERGLVTAVALGMAQIIVETAHAADTVRVNVGTVVIGL